MVKGDKQVDIIRVRLVKDAQGKTLDEKDQMIDVESVEYDEDGKEVKWRAHMSPEEFGSVPKGHRVIVIKKLSESNGGFSFAGVNPWFRLSDKGGYTVEVEFLVGSDHRARIVEVTLIRDPEGSEIRGKAYPIATGLRDRAVVREEVWSEDERGRARSQVLAGTARETEPYMVLIRDELIKTIQEAIKDICDTLDPEQVIAMLMELGEKDLHEKAEFLREAAKEFGITFEQLEDILQRLRNKLQKLNPNGDGQDRGRANGVGVLLLLAFLGVEAGWPFDMAQGWPFDFVQGWSAAVVGLSIGQTGLPMGGWDTTIISAMEKLMVPCMVLLLVAAGIFIFREIKIVRAALEKVTQLRVPLLSFVNAARAPPLRKFVKFYLIHLFHNWRTRPHERSTFLASTLIRIQNQQREKNPRERQINQSAEGGLFLSEFFGDEVMARANDQDPYGLAEAQQLVIEMGVDRFMKTVNYFGKDNVVEGFINWPYWFVKAVRMINGKGARTFRKISSGLTHRLINDPQELAQELEHFVSKNLAQILDEQKLKGIIQKVLAEATKQFNPRQYGWAQDLRSPKSRLEIRWTKKIRDGQTIETPRVFLKAFPFKGFDCFNCATELVKLLDREGIFARIAEGNNELWDTDFVAEIPFPGNIVPSVLLSVTPGIQKVQGIEGFESNTGLVVTITKGGKQLQEMEVQQNLNLRQTGFPLGDNILRPMAWTPLVDGGGSILIRAGIDFELDTLGNQIQKIIFRLERVHLTTSRIKLTEKVGIHVPAHHFEALNQKIRQAGPSSVLSAVQEIPEITLEGDHASESFGGYLRIHDDILYHLITKIGSAFGSPGSHRNDSHPKGNSHLSDVRPVEQKLRERDGGGNGLAGLLFFALPVGAGVPAVEETAVGWWASPWVWAAAVLLLTAVLAELFKIFHLGMFSSGRYFSSDPNPSQSDGGYNNQSLWRTKLQMRKYESYEKKGMVEFQSLKDREEKERNLLAAALNKGYRYVETGGTKLRGPPEAIVITGNFETFGAFYSKGENRIYFEERFLKRILAESLDSALILFGVVVHELNGSSHKKNQIEVPEAVLNTFFGEQAMDAASQRDLYGFSLALKGIAGMTASPQYRWRNPLPTKDSIPMTTVGSFFDPYTPASTGLDRFIRAVEFFGKDQAAQGFVGNPHRFVQAIRLISDMGVERFTARKDRLTLALAGETEKLAMALKKITEMRLETIFPENQVRLLFKQGHFWTADALDRIIAVNTNELKARVKAIRSEAEFLFDVEGIFAGQHGDQAARLLRKGPRLKRLFFNHTIAERMLSEYLLAELIIYQHLNPFLTKDDYASRILEILILAHLDDTYDNFSDSFRMGTAYMKAQPSAAVLEGAQAHELAHGFVPLYHSTIGEIISDLGNFAIALELRNLREILAAWKKKFKRADYKRKWGEFTKGDLTVSEEHVSARVQLLSILENFHKANYRVDYRILFVLAVNLVRGNSQISVFDFVKSLLAEYRQEAGRTEAPVEVLDRVVNGTLADRLVSHREIALIVNAKAARRPSNHGLKRKKASTGRISFYKSGRSHPMKLPPSGGPLAVEGDRLLGWLYVQIPLGEHWQKVRLILGGIIIPFWETVLLFFSSLFIVLGLTRLLFPNAFSSKGGSASGGVGNPLGLSSTRGMDPRLRGNDRLYIQTRKSYVYEVLLRFIAYFVSRRIFPNTQPHSEQIKVQFESMVKKVKERHMEGFYAGSHPHKLYFEDFDKDIRKLLVVQLGGIIDKITRPFFYSLVINFFLLIVSLIIFAQFRIFPPGASFLSGFSIMIIYATLTVNLAAFFVSASFHIRHNFTAIKNNLLHQPLAVSSGWPSKGGKKSRRPGINLEFLGSHLNQEIERVNREREEAGEPGRIAKGRFDPETQRALVKVYAAWRDAKNKTIKSRLAVNAQRAKDHLFVSVQALVITNAVNILRRFTTTMQIEDIIQHGYEIVWEISFKNVNSQLLEDKKMTFSSYVDASLKRNLPGYILRNLWGETFRDKEQRMLKRILELINSEQAAGRRLTIEEIVDKLGVNGHRTKEGSVINPQRVVCLLAKAGIRSYSANEDGLPGQGLIESAIPDPGEGLEEILDRRELKDIVNRALRQLSARERKVLKGHVAEGLTLSEVAQDRLKKKITPERVRQIKVEALRKLRRILAPQVKEFGFTEAKATGLPVDLAAVLARGFMPRASGDPKGRPLTPLFSGNDKNSSAAVSVKDKLVHCNRNF